MKRRKAVRRKETRLPAAKGSGLVELHPGNFGLGRPEIPA
jgi:hypothetical protein